MLTDITQVFRWVAYGPCTTGSSTLASSEVKKKVVSTTKANHAVLACGRSNNSGTSYLPNYPARKIEHWIVSDGYTNDGDYIWVVDPAAAGCGGSDFKSVQKYYKISVSKFTDFAWYHGIIW